MTVSENRLQADPQRAALPERLVSALAFLYDNIAPSSRRQYQHTYKLWRGYCAATDGDVLNFNDIKIRAFLMQTPLTRRTKKARLSHLRRLVAVLSAKFPENTEFEHWYKLLDQMKVKDGDISREREAKRLAPQQIYEAINYFPSQTLRGKRNRAFLGVLFYAGLRRSEAVILKWSDIDLDGGFLTVRRGKGGYRRTIPFAGPYAVGLLRAWRGWLEENGQSWREYVFPQMVKGNHLVREDVPMSDSSGYRIAQQAGDISPHVARRTLLTELIKAGTSVADTQFIAGHSSGAMTLQYAEVKDAQDVKGRVRLGY